MLNRRDLLKAIATFPLAPVMKVEFQEIIPRPFYIEDEIDESIYDTETDFEHFDCDDGSMLTSLMQQHVVAVIDGKIAQRCFYADCLTREIRRWCHDRNQPKEQESVFAKKNVQIMFKCEKVRSLYRQILVDYKDKHFANKAPEILPPINGWFYFDSPTRQMLEVRYAHEYVLNQGD